MSVFDQVRKLKNVPFSDPRWQMLIKGHSHKVIEAVLKLQMGDK